MLQSQRQTESEVELISWWEHFCFYIHWILLLLSTFSEVLIIRKKDVILLGKQDQNQSVYVWVFFNQQDEKITSILYSIWSGCNNSVSLLKLDRARWGLVTHWELHLKTYLLSLFRATSTGICFPFLRYKQVQQKKGY